MKRLGIVLILCILILCGCGGRVPSSQQTVFAMDTVMDLQVWGPDCEKATGKLQHMISELEADWSVTNPHSVLSQLNSGASPALTQHQQALLDRVLDLQKRTGGLYDPQLYALCSSWGLYDQQYRLPDAEQIRQAQQLQQWDLGGALKGYCAEQAAALLQTMDIDRAILNLGGNIQTYGSKPDGTAWQIGIQDPDGGDPLGTVSVTGSAAVVTSGDYQRSFELDGKRYHHILDPRTGHPAKSGLRSVTVICKDGLTADCLSTALFVMGLEDASEFWRGSTDFEAVFITDDGRIRATEGVVISGCEYEVIHR